MTRPVIIRVMSGMWGPVTDPGSYNFTEEIRKAVSGVDLGRSPYRDFEVQEVANDLIRAPANAVRMVVGTSLGACNCPVAATYAKAVTIHGMFGFQPSAHGADWPIPSNVLFAHEFYAPSAWWNGYLGTIITGGLGTLAWHRAKGNVRTTLILSSQYVPHPGETVKARTAFLAEIKRISAKPGDEV
jgi:hypothetical protein